MPFGDGHGGDNARIERDVHKGLRLQKDDQIEGNAYILLQEMLTRNGKSRITIAGIKKHPWFAGV